MLHLHRAERADGLVDALRALLADPLPDPFAPELVAVPTRGVERWVAQQLSNGLGATPGRRDGVCANVLFPSPRALLADAVAAGSGLAPGEDPWRPERTAWTLLEVVEASLGEPWLATLAEHLAGGAEPRARRLTAVRHLAELFDRYALHRPEMVLAWSTGAGEGWQPELWRRLRARVAHADPAERIAGACARIAAEPALLDLPPRLSVFGLTRLPAARLDVLRALAATREVHLFLLHPSPALWERVAAHEHGTVTARHDDPTAALSRNRLLASWGRDVRELQLVLERAGQHTGHHHASPTPAPSLLAAIQAGVRDDAPPPGEPLPGLADARPLLDARDRSVRVHACHGRARQVEVLRDAVLHALADDPTLEPRDVIVMCPDIEAFAPLIHAAFGTGEQEPFLEVRLADRALRQTNPLLGVVARLLELAGERLTASQVLDLADRPPVRRRFGFDDDDLARAEEWVRESGVRWGLDAADRAPYKLTALSAGTWRAGLDRLLAGVALADEALWAGVLPLGVESGAIDLAGRLAELLDRLGTALSGLRRAQPLAAWAEALGAAADALAAAPEQDAWQRGELERVLAELLEEAADAAPVDLVLEEVRALLADRLQGRPTRANFRTGHLTVCTLVPMRSVPHRVVCLLGLDDAAFPRKAPRDGDDVLLDDPHVGEPDARLEDRQLLLDALMAASDRLIVTYTGNDERTNAERPPAVPVGELLESIDRTVRLPDGAPARGAVVRRHPLQPFDPGNFTAAAPWSFDRVTLEGAAALTRPRAEPAPFLPTPLPPAPAPVIELDDLVRFAERPVRQFLRGRLGVRLAGDDEDADDALPVELGHLDQWRVGQRLLEARLRGLAVDDAVAAERARGALPPDGLAEPILERLRPTVETIARHALGLRRGDARTVDVRVALPGGRALNGAVPGVTGDLVLAAAFARVGPRSRIAAWVRLLALTVAHPGTAWEAVTVGRPQIPGAPDGARLTVARIVAPPAETARQYLDALLDLYDRGMREPLPLACRTSAAYAHAMAAGGDAEKAGARAWESGWRFPQEDVDPEHRLVLGGVRTFAELLAEPARPDEDWDDAEPSRFGRHARRLWAGPLAWEQVTHR
ncbi:MAG TPA: exodeoxyribonuclease V subunit gamma [Solirubrobacteraceae bacterium]|nr:exodeoxyribonuclease V subunit gamma [Solirubrobacteraceae bacterium]